MTRTTYISDEYANEMNMAGICYQQPPPISGPIKIDLIWCTYLHRPCSVCGAEIEKKSVVAESHWVRVCENCLLYGDQIDEILARHASRIEEKAKAIRAMIGRLQVPTYKAWREEQDRHDAYHQGIPVEEVREKRQRAREEHDKRLRESLPREWLDKYDLLTDQGRKDFLASRKEAGLKIDPATAEVIMTWAGMMDPYGIWGDDIEDNIDRAWFACAPGSDIWVEFHDLPEETRKALEGKPVANADELKALFETLENCEAVVEGDTVTFLNTEEELRDDYERRLREKGIKPLKDPPF